MDKVTELLQEPAFWIGTVLVSVLINVGTTYLMRAVDKGVFAWSAWGERRAAQRMEAKTKLIAAASSDRGLALLIARTNGLRQTSLAGVFLGFAGIAMAMYARAIGADQFIVRFLACYGVLAVCMAMVVHLRGQAYQRVLRTIEAHEGFPSL